MRVCCRTIQQLDNIAAILKEVMKFDFIMEIGMPLEYFYKMKSLVLFIKPKNKHLANSIVRVFYRYPNMIVETKDPSVSTEKKLNELEMNDSVQKGEKSATIAENGRKRCILKSAKEDRRETQGYKFRFLLFLKMSFIFLSLYYIFDSGCDED